MTIRYLSICSGIEAFTVATEGLDFAAVGFSEIDPFASAVLAERFGSNLPGEPLSANAPPNFGDFTRIPLDRLGPVDLLVGGTPCQAFSFAGKRLSLEDARGNLTLAFAVLAHELAGSHGLRNALWENVPGVLSTEDNAFGCFLGALVGADDALHLPAGIGRWPDAGMVAGPRARAAWRVLDAQYFGLAQRRERVFVVVDFGNGADPAAVLFEPQGMQGNSPPRREAGQKPAPTVAGGPRSRGGYSADDIPLTAFVADVAGTLPAGANSTGGHRHPGMGQETADTMLIAHTLRGEGFDASEDGTGRGVPIIPVYSIQERAVSENPNAGPDGMGVGTDIAYTLEARTRVQAIAFDTTQITSKANRSNPKAGDPCHPLAAAAHPPALAYRTSGNCGAWETGDMVDALTTGTDRTSHLLAYGITADALDRTGEGAGGTAGERGGLGITEELSPTLRAKRPNAVAYDLRGREGGAQFEGPHDTANIRAANGGSSRSYVAETWAVRRLVTDECARLQGFPDGWSRIPWRGKPAEECPDGPQYKTYGNSMATKVMRWLAERIKAEMQRRDAA